MRPWVVLAGLNGLMAVGLGAYAAHGLSQDAHLQMMASRASEYQLIHALAVLAADRLAADGRRAAHWAAGLFLAGIVLFSGSLYWKAIFSGSLPIPMITPAGGMTIMAGWLVLALAGLSKRK